MSAPKWNWREIHYALSYAFRHPAEVGLDSLTDEQDDGAHAVMPHSEAEAKMAAAAPRLVDALERCYRIMQEDLYGSRTLLGLVLAHSATETLGDRIEAALAAAKGEVES